MQMNELPTFYYVEPEYEGRAEPTDAYIATGLDVSGNLFSAMYNPVDRELQVVGRGYHIRVSVVDIETAHRVLQDTLPDARGYFVLTLNEEAQL